MSNIGVEETTDEHGSIRDVGAKSTIGPIDKWNQRRKRAQVLYQRFVLQGIDGKSRWNGLKGQIFLGDQRFVEGVKAHRVLDENLREVPRLQQDADRPSLAMLFDNAFFHDMPARNRAIHAAHAVHHYTLKEVGDHMRLHYTTVSRIIREQHRTLQRKGSTPRAFKGR